nr:hypothetical protein [Candidatus Baldrarchaeota archaeon]
SGKFNVRKQTETINYILKEIQEKGAKVLDEGLAIGGQDHIVSLIYIILYETEKPINIKC